MSAIISWKPVKPIKSFSVGAHAPNYFIEVAQKVFRHFPVRLSEKDLPKIEAIISLGEDGGNPWEKVKEAIEAHGEIEIFAEY